MRRRVALAGNQNSGKTTLFNQLTGQNQHVGNWPGVTVERRSGELRNRLIGDVELVDLPGIYSLSPYSMEEIVSRDFLVHEEPDAIVNCVDATSLERNLYLTVQLLQLGRPVVVALNMMDEVRRQGVRIDVAAMESALGAPVVPICARKGEGLDALTKRLTETIETRQAPTEPDVFHGSIRKTLHAVEHAIEARAAASGISARFAATKLLEGDELIAERLKLADADKRAVEEALLAMERTLGMERAAAMADARYRFIEALLATCVTRPAKWRASATDRLDGVLTHPTLAIPTFLLLMLLVFFVTFGPIGGAIADWFGGLIDGGIALLSAALRNWNVADWARELLVSGVLRGVGGVLRFLPTILLLFLLLSLLEDSGYMARAAFLMDQPLRRLGLNGRSFIPLLMGFGCTVPAVMSARGMSARRDRRFTILLTPLMSCGAKTPIYALLASAFFPAHRLPVMVGLYVTGILLAIVAALLLKRTAFRGEATPFLMEMPPYRLPSPRGVARQLRDKAGDFLGRAFTVIFLSTLIVWFLQGFTFRLATAERMETSMLGQIAGVIAPLLAPCGFGNAQASTAILTGVMAKESVVSTLAVLCGAQTDGALMHAALRNVFPSALSAACFLLFVLLYTPCVAACAAMRRELESGRIALLAALAQTALAWLVAAGVYQLGLLLGLG